MHFGRALSSAFDMESVCAVWLDSLFYLRVDRIMQTDLEAIHCLGFSAFRREVNHLFTTRQRTDFIQQSHGTLLFFFFREND